MADRVEGRLRIHLFRSGESQSPIAKLSAFCPACDFEHGFRVDLEGHGLWGVGNTWDFDGNWEKPTFSPSMGANMGGTDKLHPVCHSFLENGLWKFQGDCTHSFAGQVLEVPYPDPELSFARQHGWHLYPHWKEGVGE